MERLREVLAKKEETPDQADRVALSNFLVENDVAIRALRSLSQALGGYFRLDHEQLEELRRLIRERSSGRLNWKDGFLSQINVETLEMVPSHEYGFGGFGEREYKEGKALRGLFFYFEASGYYFECFDLDAGLSCRWFDLMGKGKRKFIKHLANHRMRVTSMYGADPTINSSLGYAFAFLTDTPQGYKIEELVSYSNPSR